MSHKCLFRFIRKHRGILSALCISIGTAYYFYLPDPLFADPVSIVLVDKDNQMLSARIAEDGQWRFPHASQIPEKYKQAIICFEDKRYYRHPGIDPLALFRALKLNIEKAGVVSGGSTLSMQVIRLSRKNKRRNLLEKLIEMILATRLESKYSKEEILALYASNAPFGGNVVGLEAASWKYFGRSPSQLSWAETATLAVLPNAPGLIHPGKNRRALKEKRDRLLTKLYANGVMDSVTCYLSQAEPLPESPLPLPDLAPHLIERIRKGKEASADALIRCTLDAHIQQHTEKIIEKHHHYLKENGIHNAAALVIDTKTGNILAYIGNTKKEGEEHGNAVDIIKSARSTGSILKPVLYALMLHEGYLLPHTLVADIPTSYGSYTPKNFDLNYDGALPASLALSRSLNIPLSRMLHQYGVEKFYRNLKTLGITTLAKEAKHYGLSMVLGGAETTLEEIAGVYAGMARTLENYEQYNQYDPDCFRPLNYHLHQTYQLQEKNLGERSALDAASIWYTFESMSEVVRPEPESNWQSYGASKIAWKTGTSFGFRDAWAIGSTPEYTVAVWAGNADGEGRPGLTGISAAAPILFDIFNGLKNENTWFKKPVKCTKTIAVCKKSGHRATELCTETEILEVPAAGLRSSPCPYHKRIHLDTTGTWQVHDGCCAPAEMVTRSWFVLPPVQELYYKSKNPDYIVLPEFKEACSPERSRKKSIEMIYPDEKQKIYVPVYLDGTAGQVVFQATTSEREEILYWHIDDVYIGNTKAKHERAFTPPQGKHLLTIVTDKGELLKRPFEIVVN